jgi:hypothetical protein
VNEAAQVSGDDDNDDNDCKRMTVGEGRVLAPCCALLRVTACFQPPAPSLAFQPRPSVGLAPPLMVAPYLAACASSY